MDVLKPEDISKCPDDDKELSRDSYLSPTFFSHEEIVAGGALCESLELHMFRSTFLAPSHHAGKWIVPEEDQRNDLAAQSAGNKASRLGVLFCGLHIRIFSNQYAKFSYESFAEFFFHTREQAGDWRGTGVREVQ